MGQSRSPYQQPAPSHRTIPGYNPESGPINIPNTGGGAGQSRPYVHRSRGHYYWGYYYPRVIPTIVIITPVPRTTLRTVHVTQIQAEATSPLDVRTQAMINPNLFDARILLKDDLKLPITDAKPVEASSEENVVVLLNPSTNGASVRYLIGGHAYEAEPSEKQLLTKTWWTIDLDRGEQHGRTTISFTPGVYHFSMTETGWEPKRQTVIVTLTNRENVQPFHVLAGGEEIAIAPGETVKLEHDRPIELVYSQDSLDTVKRVLLSGNTYKVGIDAKTGKWDLFRETKEMAAAAKPAPPTAEKPTEEKPASDKPAMAS